MPMPVPKGTRTINAHKSIAQAVATTTNANREQKAATTKTQDVGTIFFEKATTIL